MLNYLLVNYVTTFYLLQNSKKSKGYKINQVKEPTRIESDWLLFIKRINQLFLVSFGISSSCS